MDVKNNKYNQFFFFAKCFFILPLLAIRRTRKRAERELESTEEKEG
jgi:hypothetical protein